MYSESFCCGTQELPFMMPPSTIENVQVVYKQTIVPWTGYNHFQKAILWALYEEKGIYVRSTGVQSSDPTKYDYIRALLDNVSAHVIGNSENLEHMSPPQPTTLVFPALIIPSNHIM